MSSDVGFTGTQIGQTPEQLVVVERLFSVFSVLHHGDCIGADAQAHAIARALGLRVWQHPPLVSAKRAFTDYDVACEPDEYIPRNHCIVDHVKQLIATPKTMSEELRSGTWATVRYAKKIGVPVWIVYPNGYVDD